MPKKKSKKPAVKPSAPLRWDFDPDIPTHDFFEDMPLTDPCNLQEAVDSFIDWLEEDRFLAWEAVMRDEQGQRLTGRQKEVLDDLLNFNEEDDEDDDGILYIDEIPRPSEPWHVILNKIVPHLLIEPYRTSDFHDDVSFVGWSEMMSALKDHGKGLSLPQGAKSPEEVIPAELRHKLWLQFCLNDLNALGFTEDLTLENERQEWRIDSLVNHLREYKRSVKFFDLTLTTLMDRIVFSERDQAFFVYLMKKKLGLTSGTDRLADHL